LFQRLRGPSLLLLLLLGLERISWFALFAPKGRVGERISPSMAGGGHRAPRDSLQRDSLPLDGFAKRGLCSNAIEPLVGRGRPTRPQLRNENLSPCSKRGAGRFSLERISWFALSAPKGRVGERISPRDSLQRDSLPNSPPQWLCKEGALSQRHRAPRRPLFERPLFQRLRGPFFSFAFGCCSSDQRAGAKLLGPRRPAPAYEGLDGVGTKPPLCKAIEGELRSPTSPTERANRANPTSLRANRALCSLDFSCFCCWYKKRTESSVPATTTKAREIQRTERRPLFLVPTSGLCKKAYEAPCYFCYSSVKLKN
jgi:hypothetical protein